MGNIIDPKMFSQKKNRGKVQPKSNFDIVVLHQFATPFFVPIIFILILRLNVHI